MNYLNKFKSNLIILAAPLFITISGCATTNLLVNPKPESSVAQQRIVDLLDSFESNCLDRDLVANPSPRNISTVHSKFSDIIGDEHGKISRSCNFWSWRLGKFGAYDRSFITFQQQNFFISELKKRFGVIYHSVTDMSPGMCAKAKHHTMLLRDGVSTLDVIFAVQEHSFICDKTFGQGYALRLSRLKLYDEKKPNYYSVGKIDIFNVDRLNDEEKLIVSKNWDNLSVNEKNIYTKGIADRIDQIRRLHAHYNESHNEYVQSMRNTSRILQQKEQESRERFNKSLSNSIIQSLNSTDSHIYSTDVKYSTYKNPVITPNIFKDQKGFDVRQLPENINVMSSNSGEAKISSASNARKNNTPSKDMAANTRVIKKEKSKVYEPMPTTADGTNDMWDLSRERNLALARLKAVNKITALCRAKGARSDTVSYDDIKAGSPPSRWSFASPNCRQGGFNGKEWKCEVSVSGTCYRMQ